ncbi:hypothetical protein B0H21DRAFT_756798 [Amylocystis lapponica]|nr:hypothetical protein B0H21DRAFT_756798 [Amylocystis lapponica]
MPHKRAKRTVREQQRSQSGSDLPPAVRAISNEAIPKSVARVLNAAQVRKEWSEKNNKREPREGQDPPHVQPASGRKRKRKDGNNEETQAKKAKITIQPGESMAHFNRRVEDTMRPAVRTAMKTSSAHTRQARKNASTSAASNNKKEEAQPNTNTASADDQAETNQQQRKPPKEFEHLSSSAPRRLNDIVLAPPEFKKLPRGAKAATERNQNRGDGATLKQSALSMARKAMLEEERERAIRMYREMRKVSSDG